MFAWCYSAQAQSVAKINLNSAGKVRAPAAISFQSDLRSRPTRILRKRARTIAMINTVAAQVDSAKQHCSHHAARRKNVWTTQQLEQAKQIPA